MPNVTAAGLDLSGMTQAEAEQAINENLSVAQQVLRLIDKLEDLDDVQSVHSNADIASEVLDQISEQED